MAIQLTVRGVTTSSSEALNLFVLTNELDISTAASALETFYGVYATKCNGSVSFSLEPEYREFNPATGQTITIGAVPGADQWTVVGTASDDNLPDQTAILVRWRSDTWVNGRRVTGRSYLPYPASSTGSGQVANGTVTDIQNAANALVASNAFWIWSRVNGVLQPVQSASVWNEYASQRRRRD